MKSPWLVLVFVPMLNSCFNYDYALDYGWKDVYINVMHGDGELLVTRNGGSVISGGVNKFEGSVGTKLFFSCTSIHEKLKCFSERFYFDQEKKCIEISHIPQLLVREIPVKRPIKLLEQENDSHLAIAVKTKCAI